MKKLNEIDWFFIISVIGFAALAVSAAYAIGKIITEVIRWGVLKCRRVRNRGNGTAKRSTHSRPSLLRRRSTRFTP